VGLVTVLGGDAVAVTVKPGDSSDASLCRDTNRCPLSPPVYPFYPSSSFSLTVSLGFPVDIPGFFVFLSFSRFSLSISPLFLSFSSSFPLSFFLFPFLFFVWVVFIGAGGAGSTLPRPIIARAL